MLIPSKNMLDPNKAWKNQSIYSLLALNLKKSVKFHHQVTEQKIILNDLQC